VQDRDALARESQAKSEMLATLSREIRSHLNGIIGSADLMFDQSLKPPQREHLATLRASAESLHQSLNDVLDYSSIETGQLQIASAPFDLQQPLIEVVETLSPLALLKKLELVLIVAPDVPRHVTGDAARVRQILFNLMSNAVKFTARGRVVLRVELSQGSVATSTSGATWLHFSVSDTGTGIPRRCRRRFRSRHRGRCGLRAPVRRLRPRAIDQQTARGVDGRADRRAPPARGRIGILDRARAAIARVQPPALSAARIDGMSSCSTIRPPRASPPPRCSRGSASIKTPPIQSRRPPSCCVKREKKAPRNSSCCSTNPSPATTPADSPACSRRSRRCAQPSLC